MSHFQESKLANQWLELFRVGDYGEKGSFNNSDLDQIVANFDPSFHEPPAVIGHPADNAPAYAWIEGLKRSDNTLLGKLKQVDPQFEEMVKAGRFKKRSVSLYQTAKGWMLRHVGFLGAQPPEIKGLSNATFREGGNSFVEMSFSESQSQSCAAIDRLKARGYWLSDFDRYGIPVLFAELEQSPALNVFVRFLEQTVEGAARAHRSNVQDAVAYMESASMSRRARDISMSRGINFGEALDQVADDDTSAQAISRLQRDPHVNANSLRLSQLTKEFAQSHRVTFGEALSRVAAEYPDLTI